MRDRLNVIVALSVYGSLMIRATDALDAVPVSRPRRPQPPGLAGARRSPWSCLSRTRGCWLGCSGVDEHYCAGLGDGIVEVNLGMLFVDGFQRGILAEVVAGIVATVAVALAVDFVLVIAGRLLMPWARGEEVRS